MLTGTSKFGFSSRFVEFAIPIRSTEAPKSGFAQGAPIVYSTVIVDVVASARIPHVFAGYPAKALQSR